MPLIGPALLTAGYPLVLTMHAAAPSWARRLYRLTPRTWWQGRVLTAVSSAAVPPLDHPVRIIPNGIGLDLYRPEGEKQPRRVVFLGRDDPRKGLSILRSAWPLVRTRVPGAELFVLGAEGESQEGLSFRGRVSEEEKQAQLGAAAVLVAPNTGGESFGISLVEGMAAGCALVASDLAAFREVSGGAARLVPPGDPLALAGALADLLVDPTARAELGERARVQAARYDWSAVLPQYLQCYLALTGGSPSPG
jgi:phosphatidylinositol alpha-mannosyltransferase